ncbi:MAG: AAA family ATPase [Lachnospiraceae bacterium]|nr:AAA family ATPase [Lachnospiraceae bacterium]
MSYKPLPIGVDDFEKIRAEDYYYVDKTWFIKELLDKKGEVNLFTRPRRFGKTLNLSMLKYYFEKPIDGKNHKEIFDGLRIMDAGVQYTKSHGKYPVIMLTLKSAKQPNWEVAYRKLREVVAQEFQRHEQILPLIKNEKQKKKYISLRDEEADYSVFCTSLVFLSECLCKAYQEKVVILIDEYDVPLENAFYHGFYNEMAALIRSLFESTLKSNPYLEFSVITGCLRSSKESIFTGLNNLKISSILDKEYSEHFGFVEEEVRQILSFYGRENKMNVVKEWYDGYRFGDTGVYNPWSVISFTEKLYTDEDTFPVALWSNTSSNSIVKDLIYRADKKVQGEIETLVLGQTIEKKVHEDITYEDIYETDENLWNFLFFTGYLKQTGKKMIGDDIYLELALPNREVRSIYRNQIENWFRDEVKLSDLSRLYDSMLTGKTEVFQRELMIQLQRTISYMDGGESFYQGFLLGLLANLKEYFVKSNREAGLGRYDIFIYSLDVSIPPVIIELKIAERYKELDYACERALSQVEEMKYYAGLAEEGYTEVICYGIGFFKKQLRIHMERKSKEIR